MQVQEHHDCVRFGILNIVKEKPDYVFSGINYGYNSGTDIQYSATVGSALENLRAQVCMRLRFLKVHRSVMR